MNKNRNSIFFQEEAKDDKELAASQFFGRNKSQKCVTVYQKVCSEPVIDFYMFIKGSCKVVEKVECGPQVRKIILVS